MDPILGALCTRRYCTPLFSPTRCHPGTLSSDHTARRGGLAPEDEIWVLWERERGGDLVFCPESGQTYLFPRPVQRSSPHEA